MAVMFTLMQMPFADAPDIKLSRCAFVLDERDFFRPLFCILIKLLLISVMFHLYIKLKVQPR